jgi:hypothetical protein
MDAKISSKEKSFALGHQSLSGGGFIRLGKNVALRPDTCGCGDAVVFRRSRSMFGSARRDVAKNRSPKAFLGKAAIMFGPTIIRIKWRPCFHGIALSVQARGNVSSLFWFFDFSSGPLIG